MRIGFQKLTFKQASEGFFHPPGGFCILNAPISVRKGTSNISFFIKGGEKE